MRCPATLCMGSLDIWNIRSTYRANAFPMPFILTDDVLPKFQTVLRVQSSLYARVRSQRNKQKQLARPYVDVGGRHWLDRSHSHHCRVHKRKLMLSSAVTSPLAVPSLSWSALPPVFSSSSYSPSLLSASLSSPFRTSWSSNSRLAKSSVICPTPSARRAADCHRMPDSRMSRSYD